MTNPTPHGQVPEALRLAHIFDNPLPPEWPDMVAAAAELRRQHARIAELEARVQELGAMARENRSRRIVELEAQLEAVGAGGVQALSAAPGAVSDTKYSQFLSDVLTAAGLITHGKQCKALGERLADMVMRLRAAPQQEAQEPVADEVRELIAAMVSELRGHRWCGDCYPENGWPGVNRVLADYARFKRHKASQLAPSPLSDDVVRDAARYQWLREPHLAVGQGSIEVTIDDRASGLFNRPIYGAALDAAIDTALAAQGEKDAG